MCEGTTYLLAKSNDTKNPKNYRPMTCLSTAYKLLTLVLTDRTWCLGAARKETKFEFCMDWLQKSIW